MSIEDGCDYAERSFVDRRGACNAAPKYEVETGMSTRYACVDHLAGVLSMGASYNGLGTSTVTILPKARPKSQTEVGQSISRPSLSAETRAAVKGCLEKLITIGGASTEYSGTIALRAILELADDGPKSEHNGWPSTRQEV